MKFDLTLQFDTDELADQIKAAQKLETDEAVFAGLAKVVSAKKDLATAKEALDKVESTVKSAINDKAKALYGPNWQAIAGQGFKITRSQSGAVYEVLDNEQAIDAGVVKVDIKPDTDKINEFLETKEKLPPGIGRNESRTEQIRITLEDNDAGNN